MLTRRPAGSAIARGALAVDALLAELDGAQRAQTPLVGTELVVRGSTAPPRPRR